MTIFSLGELQPVPGGGFRNKDGSFGSVEIKASAPLLLYRMQIKTPQIFTAAKMMFQKGFSLKFDAED